MTAFGRVALDAKEVPAPSNGGDWRLARYLWTEPGVQPIYARAAREAGLTLPSRGDKR